MRVVFKNCSSSMNNTPDRKNRRESSTSAGNRLVRVASARCTMHYRCNAGPHTHTWRENGGRGGVDSIFPSLSLSLSRPLLSLLLANVNPSCHPWVQPLSSLKQRASLDNISIGGRRYCFRIFMLGLVGIVLKDKRERNLDICIYIYIYTSARDREFPSQRPRSPGLFHVLSGWISRSISF